jgi:hypothetical protein
MRAQKEKKGENYRLFLNTTYLAKWFAREETRIPPKPQPEETPTPAETKEDQPVPESTEPPIEHGDEAVKMLREMREKAGLGRRGTKTSESDEQPA